MINWTDNQRQAIQKTGNILIEAGAGSGKTAVMVHRYLNYFLNDPKLKPQQVVMITFTKKAAQELKDRLQKTIQDPAYQILKNRFENESNPFEN